MAKNIRSEYVKNLLEDKEALEKQLKGITESTIKSLLEDEVKELRARNQYLEEVLYATKKLYGLED